MGRAPGVVLARMGRSRFPGRPFAPLFGRPLGPSGPGIVTELSEGPIT